MSDYGDHEATDDPLQKLRHSAAHLLAAAVTELYPEAKYGIGPPVQDGFYYDFDFENQSQSRISRESNRGCEGSHRPTSPSSTKFFRGNGPLRSSKSGVRTTSWS